MPDSLFHLMVYAMPSLVAVAFPIVGLLSIRQVAEQAPLRPRVVLLASLSWLVVSLFVVATGYVAGRLYDHVVAVGRHHPRDGLPTRPGLIVLGFLALQVGVGSVLMRWLRGRRRTTDRRVA